MAGDRNINMGAGGNYIEKIDGNYIQGNYYAGDRQALAESAREIQDLLKQLEQDNPSATETEKENFVNDKVKATTKTKLLSAAKEGGIAAIEEIFDSPYVRIVRSVIDGWQKG